MNISFFRVACIKGEEITTLDFKTLTEAFISVVDQIKGGGDYATVRSFYEDGTSKMVRTFWNFEIMGN